MSGAAERWPRSALGYCSNVHPGETPEALSEVLDRHLGPVRELRGLDAMSSGLWISAAAARQLRRSAADLSQFRAALARNSIELLTLNGFPYGEFHARVVKERVYRPDWSDSRRSAYTLDLAETLAACLPANAREGTISTLALGFEPDWDPDRHAVALDELLGTVAALADLRARTGRSIRLCLEMEPGCVLERTEQALRFFTEEIPAHAGRYHFDDQAVSQHLGLCFDVCHQAVMFEQPEESLTRIRDAGIVVGKIQISNALQAPDPVAARAALETYVEPRYLHQVRCRSADGTLLSEMDLHHALESAGLPRQSTWRVHFHVPIYACSLAGGALGTTRDAIERTLDFLATHAGDRPHLEVETYTWKVLPEDRRPAGDTDLNPRLVAELAWLERGLARRGLLEDAA